MLKTNICNNRDDAISKELAKQSTKASIVRRFCCLRKRRITVEKMAWTQKSVYLIISECIFCHFLFNAKMTLLFEQNF